MCRENGVVNSYALTGLEKYATYSVSVEPINLAGKGEKATQHNITTREEGIELMFYA